MTLQHRAWIICAMNALCAALCASTVLCADNPPPIEKPPLPPAVAPPNFPVEALNEAMRRQREAEDFVQEFQFSSSGVDLAKELKVTGEQTTKLDAIVARLRQEMSAAARLQLPAPGEPRDQLQRQLLEQMNTRTAMYERAKNDIAAVLSPEQITRVEQICLQSRMRTSGMARGLTTEPTAQFLSLTPDQVAKLKDAEAAAQEQFRKEYDELRDRQRQSLAEARKKVLSVLTPEQRATYEKLVGTPIEVNDRTLDYGVAGVSARVERLIGRGFGFGRPALPNLRVPPGAAPPAVPAPGAPPNP
jgi:hypothetical protein